MNSSSLSSKEDGRDFPFQFMLDARSSPLTRDWDKSQKDGSTSILAPFQWSPPDSSNHPQKFTAGIIGFYNSPNMFQDDDSFNFFDQSFLFTDENAQQPGPISLLPTIPRDNQHRLSFSSRLTRCHRRRMSTITEYPVNEDESSTEEEDDGGHETESAIATQTEWGFRTEQSQESSFQKLFDYVVPYPTRRVKGKLAKQNKQKSSFAIALPRSASIKTTDSGSTSTSDSSWIDEEWVAHGFFEICTKAVA